MSNKPFLSLQHVEKVYPNGEKAVYDFNLNVEKNEFIVIVGPSGCGKSTTLRMIAGLEDITSGDIYLEDELLNYKPSKDRKMAIVFQSYALYPQMNVFENIAFPLTINEYSVPAKSKQLYPLGEIQRLLAQQPFDRIVRTLAEISSAKGSESKKREELAAVMRISSEAAGRLFSLYTATVRSGREADLSAWTAEIDAEIAEKKKLAEANGEKLNAEFCLLNEKGEVLQETRKFHPYEIRNKVFDVAQKLDLVPYLDKLPKELSGGQMQRVALGRAIIKDVPIFMMDEPLSNLDAKLRLTMRSEIVKLHNRINATTIYVTHDQTEAMTMATRIVVMSRGFVQQIGTPEEVYNQPDNIFVARFIGSPSMNIFEGNFTREGGKLTFGGLEYTVEKDFLAKHDAFYRRKIAEFEAMLRNFDLAARENILKILSATRSGKPGDGKGKKKKSFFAGVRGKFRKEEVPAETYSFEKGICEAKLAELKEYLNGDHPLTVGVRSERMKIEKAAESTHPGAVHVHPTVCELLDGEYNVHFDFCGKDMVGRFDAKDKITPKDEITVYFAPENMQIFDPVTGDVIR